MIVVIMLIASTELKIQDPT